jgi:hypothetical protein
MTIENTPPLLDENWRKQWSQSRYERLLDSIDEYLCDDGEDCGAEPLIRDLKMAISYAREWPQRQLSNMNKALDAINDIH